MKILKRSQLAMLSVAFMIMIAGYINYKYDPKREEGLGSIVRVDNANVDIYSETKQTILDKEDSLYKNKDDEDNNKSLAEYKNSRDNMFSELEATYKELLSINVDSSEVKVYNEKIDEIIKKKHLIEIVEGIIKAKGIEEIVIIPTDDTYNVMVTLDSKNYIGRI